MWGLASIKRKVKAESRKTKPGKFMWEIRGKLPAEVADRRMQRAYGADVQDTYPRQKGAGKAQRPGTVQ